jgi:hypothetical protein
MNLLRPIFCLYKEALYADLHLYKEKVNDKSINVKTTVQIKCQMIKCQITIARKCCLNPRQHVQICWIRVCLYDPTLPGQYMKQDDFDVLK